MARALDVLAQGLSGVQGEGVILLASGALVAAVFLGLGWSVVRWLLPAGGSRPAGGDDANAPTSATASATASAPVSHAFAHAFSASAADLPDGELCRVAGIPRDLLPLLRARPSRGADASLPTGVTP